MKLTLYGCMATNHRSGVIEVVKNAMTISEVNCLVKRKNLTQYNVHIERC